jgi:parallel beta-helix repeat protein
MKEDLYKKLFALGANILLVSIVIVPIVGSTVLLAPYRSIGNTDKCVMSTIFLKTIIVPDDYPTIQEAINHAQDGDRILVRPGTYPENIFVDKRVNITGSGNEITIIDGCGKDNTVTIARDGVQISFFTIRNSGTRNAGIYANNAHYNDFILNIISENADGIRLNDSTGNRILNNWILNNTGEGIWLGDSHMNEIKGNEISDNDINVLVDLTSTFNTISGNSAARNQEYGIAINAASRSNTITFNTVTTNKIGVHCIGASDNNLFHHNDFKDNQQNAFDSSYDYWNSTIGKGNYWSDFDEPSEGAWDNDSNGVIDDAYPVPGGTNLDNFPLAKPVSPITPVLDGPENVHVNMITDFHVYTPNPIYPEVKYQIYWGNGDYSEDTPNMVDTTIGTTLAHAWSEMGPRNIRARAFIEIEIDGKITRKYSDNWCRKVVSVPFSYDKQKVFTLSKYSLNFKKVFSIISKSFPIQMKIIHRNDIIIQEYTKDKPELIDYPLDTIDLNNRYGIYGSIIIYGLSVNERLFDIPFFNKLNIVP